MIEFEIYVRQKMGPRSAHNVRGQKVLHGPYVQQQHADTFRVFGSYLLKVRGLVPLVPMPMYI
jgi:hypothetical protein